MQDGSGRIVVANLSKRFGPVPAVDQLSFTVEPGSVTGFLGPNGAGKTTALRMILGLVTPSGGEARINGCRYHELGNPAAVVGAVLEAQSFHSRRSARNHLRVFAAAIGVGDHRADELLHMVGLAEVAHRRIGGFSLGMAQRLALATALLGDPQVLVLDEPANGLDPEGIAWLRRFLRGFASQGRTVLVSSHLLAEVEQTIDQVVIISQGRTMYYGRLDGLRGSEQPQVLVQAGDPAALVSALAEHRITDVSSLPDGRLAVRGASVQQVGDLAAAAGVALYGVQEQGVDLEQKYFQLTSGQYAAQQYGAPYGPEQYGPVQQYAGAGADPRYQQQQPGPWQQPPQQPPQGPPPQGPHDPWQGQR